MLKTDFVKSPVAGSNYLMVVLHGLGDSMEGYRWLPQFLGLRQLNYLLVDAPDEYFGGFSWYNFAGNEAVGIERSRKELVAILDTQEQAGFPADHIFLFGFSQGCVMTIETGLKYSKRLAGLIGVSGYVFNPEDLLKNLSPVALKQEILMTHGTRDPMIPFKAVKEQVDQLREAGLEVGWKEFTKEHTIAGEEELGLIREFVQRRMEWISASKPGN